MRSFAASKRAIVDSKGHTNGWLFDPDWLQLLWSLGISNGITNHSISNPGYRNDIASAQRFPFALFSAVPSLSIIVVISEIGLRTKTMNTDIATALIGAALLSILLFPTIGGALLARAAAQAPGDRPLVRR